MEKLNKVLLQTQQTEVKVNEEEITLAVEDALDLLDLERIELSILFVGSEYMRELNKHYRHINKTTDVLSFPMYESPDEFPVMGPILLGDIIVNVEMAEQTSHENESSLHNELVNLLVHGLLHLLGYDHERGQNDERLMFEKEKELKNML